MKRLFLAFMAAIMLCSIITSCTDETSLDDDGTNPQQTDQGNSTNPKSPPQDPEGNGED